MAHVSLRVSDREKALMESYARLHGVNLSDALKEAFFEKLEDEYDLNMLRKYEQEKHSEIFYPLDEIIKEFSDGDV